MRPIVLLAAALCAVPAARAEDALDAPSLLAHGRQGIADALRAGDAAGLRDAVALVKRARHLLEARLAEPGVGRDEQARLRGDLQEAADLTRIAEAGLADLAPPPGAAEEAPGSGPAAGGGSPGGEGSREAHARDLKEGERLGAWVKDALAQYRGTADGPGRAALACEMAGTAGVIAVPALLELFRSESEAVAREGVHEGLARVGTSRVAEPMAALARRDAEERWPQALDVVYRALERPEAAEPERPWCRAIRAFHRLEERKLSLAIVTRLDAMGGPGVAALGEILYVEDFGYHDHTVALLATKRDRRAVPPLVFKLNRFRFEAMEQMPAHRALLALGWYAVPELIERLDDKAAGVWISWTLRKITGETMGTDKRKWHDWWKGESVRHPELFEDPAERPGGAPAVTPTTPR